jgi:hypothetical protein
MNNFTDTVVFTPAGITSGIQGELGGVFTGAGDVNGFVTGFSLTNDLDGALGGLGLLEGSSESFPTIKNVHVKKHPPIGGCFF